MTGVQTCALPISHEIFYSTQINTQQTSLLSLSIYQLLEHPTPNRPWAVFQQQLPQQYHGSALAVHSTPAFTAPNIQLPNYFTQYPSVATHLSSKPPSSTRLSIQINIQRPSGSTPAATSAATPAVLRQRSSRTQHTSFYSTQ